MKKIIAVLLVMMMSALSVSAQGDSTIVRETSYDKFTSFYGERYRYIDRYVSEILPNGFGTYIINCALRTFIVDKGEYRHFVLLEYPGNYTVIDYKDFLRTADEALRLRKEFDEDKNFTYDRLANYYISEDRLKIGYYIEDTKWSWFIALYSGKDYDYGRQDFKYSDKFYQSFMKAADEIKRLVKSGDWKQSTSGRLIKIQRMK